MRRRYDGLREVFIHAFVVWVGVLGDTEFLYLSERVSCCGVLVPDSIAVRVWSSTTLFSPFLIQR
jgi:hypothetical protein